MPSNHHIVVGAGATGSATAKLLAETGAHVTVVTRSGSGPDHERITLVAADASNPSGLTRLSQGAHAIYNCANPPYNKWASDWPPLAASLPLDPPSVKGGIRADMWRQALAAHETGRVQVTEARASDFIGPDIGENGRMSDRLVPRLLKGKSVSLPGELDVIHSWTAIDDVARTLVTLGTDDRALGRAWHVPTAPPVSQRDMVHRLCEIAGIKPVKVSKMPALAISLAGLFMPVVRELKEVAYQFDAPFVIDSTETTKVFGLEPTPIDETLRATLESYGHSGESDLLIQRQAVAS